MTRTNPTTARFLVILAAVWLLTVLLLLAARAPLAHAAGAAEGAGNVSIDAFAFSPETITIAAGDSVTWKNDDGAPHGLLYRDGAAGTDLLLPGASFTRRFDRPGTYEYSCPIHPYMTGRVVVRDR
jgi:plastocyanin